MREILVRESVRQDAADMAPHLRPEDLAELTASVGPDVTPEEVLTASINYSDDPRTVLVDGEPIAIFGVVDTGEVNPTVGSIWLLGTPVIQEISREFLRQCQKHLDQQGENYEVLTNYVDGRNTVHIRWLQWLGFTIIREEESHGVEQRPFYEFARVNINV
ncbi:MAG: DUF2833 domain-containing protein [Gammaproteobacteria bacterium]|nr:DUF2833 domain-containing protein [Gammaproteobacteria bacterium]